MKRLRTTEDIIIPAGTILGTACNERGGNNYLEAPVAIGVDFTAWLVMQRHDDLFASGKVEEIKDD